MSRITFEVTSEQHHKIKVLASLRRKTIKELFLENLLKNTSRECNAETLQAMEDIEKKRNLSTYKTVDELFDKLGIK